MVKTQGIAISALLVLASVTTLAIKPASQEVEVQAKETPETQLQAVSEDPDQELLDRLDMGEDLVRDHTQLVTDALTDTTPPVAEPVSQTVPEAEIEVPETFPGPSQTIPDLDESSTDSEDFVRALQAASETWPLRAAGRSQSRRQRLIRRRHRSMCRRGSLLRPMFSRRQISRPK